MNAPELQEISHGPVWRSLPQETHADLGLVDDDHTPDMRRVPQCRAAM